MNAISSNWYGLSSGKARNTFLRNIQEDVRQQKWCNSIRRHLLTWQRNKNQRSFAHAHYTRSFSSSSGMPLMPSYEYVQLEKVKFEFRF